MGPIIILSYSMIPSVDLARYGVFSAEICLLGNCATMLYIHRCRKVLNIQGPRGGGGGANFSLAVN